MDFGALPPEINSARMYSGPGSGPMMAAASAWSVLAAELDSTAASYASVVSALTGGQWLGPASAQMAAAAAPYVAWLSDAATQAAQTAAQAEMAAAAYEAAFAATVPPAVIAANRAQLMSLIATNFLGLNTPAIMATEAQYMEMWAQDTAAMFGYAGTSATASQLTAFSPPQQTTTSTGVAAQSAAVGQAATTSAGTGQSTLSQLMSAVSGALQGLASPASSTTSAGSILDAFDVFSPTSASSTYGVSGLLNSVSGVNGSAFGQLLNSTLLNSIFGSGFYMPSNWLSPVTDLVNMGGQGASGAAGEAAGAAEGVAAAAVNTLGTPLGSLGSLGNPVSAGLGNAASIGRMSVPASWTAPSATAGPLASGLGGTPMVAPPAGTPGIPGMPLGNVASNTLGRAVPQYGFRPTFVTRPPSAG